MEDKIMGRRARIGMIDEKGKVTSVHIQWHKPETTGTILLEVYNTQEKLQEVLNCGHLESISYIGGKPTDYKTSYKGADFGEIVVQPKDVIHKLNDGFIRISPFDNKSGPDIDRNFEKFCDKGYDMERFFLLIAAIDEETGEREERWWMSSRDVDRAIPLEMIKEMLHPDVPKTMYEIVEGLGF